MFSFSGGSNGRGSEPFPVILRSPLCATCQHFFHFLNGLLNQCPAQGREAGPPLSSYSRLHMETIGLIGVGLLGSAIAARLSAAAYSVLGYDLIPERRLGAGSAQEVAGACRTIILCLPTSDIVAEVLAGIKLVSGTAIIDCTTGEPEAMAALGAKLPKRSI